MADSNSTSGRGLANASRKTRERVARMGGDASSKKRGKNNSQREKDHQ